MAKFHIKSILSLVLIVIFQIAIRKQLMICLIKYFNQKIILSENYIGDWGSHQNKFIIKANNKNVKILWKNQNLSIEKEFICFIAKSALDTLHDIFCIVKTELQIQKQQYRTHTYKLKQKKHY